MELRLVVLTSTILLQWIEASVNINPSRLAPINEGNALTLNCVVRPVYSLVEWWKDKIKLSKNSLEYFPDEYLITYDPKNGLHRYKLVVQSVTKENDGQFKCKAYRSESSRNPKVRSILVTVNYKPQSQYPLCEINTTENYAVCVSEKGNPLYEFGWQRRTFASLSSVPVDSNYLDVDKYMNKRVVQLNNVPTPLREDDTLMCVFISETNRNCTLSFGEIYNTLDPPSISPRNITAPVGEDATVNCFTSLLSLNATIHFNYVSLPRHRPLDTFQSENSLQFIRLPQDITRIDVSCHLRWGPFDTIQSNVSSITVLHDLTSNALTPLISTDLAKRFLTQSHETSIAFQSASITTMPQDEPSHSTADSSFSKPLETAPLDTGSYISSAENDAQERTTKIPLLSTGLFSTEYYEMVTQSKGSFDAKSPQKFSTLTQPPNNSNSPSFTTIKSAEYTMTNVKFETPAKSPVVVSSSTTVSSTSSSSASEVSHSTTNPTTALPSKQSTDTAIDQHTTTTNHVFLDERLRTIGNTFNFVSRTEKPITAPDVMDLTTIFATNMGDESDETSFSSDDWTRQVTSDYITSSTRPILTANLDEFQTTLPVRTKLISERSTDPVPSATQTDFDLEGTDSTLLSTAINDFAEATLLGSTFHSDTTVKVTTRPLESETVSSSHKEQTYDRLTSAEQTILTISTVGWNNLQTPKTVSKSTEILNEPTGSTADYHTALTSDHEGKPSTSTSMSGQSTAKPFTSTEDHQGDLARTSKSQESVGTAISTVKSTTKHMTENAMEPSKTSFKQGTFSYSSSFTSQPYFVKSTRMISKTRQLDVGPIETTTSSNVSTGTDGTKSSSLTPSPQNDGLLFELWLLILLIVAGIVVTVLVLYVVWIVIRKHCTQYGQYKVVTKPVWVNSSPGTIGLHETHL